MHHAPRMIARSDAIATIIDLLSWIAQAKSAAHSVTPSQTALQYSLISQFLTRQLLKDCEAPMQVAHDGFYTFC